jgi:hypothetical protein
MDNPTMTGTPPEGSTQRHPEPDHSCPQAQVTALFLAAGASIFID